MAWAFVVWFVVACLLAANDIAAKESWALEDNSDIDQDAVKSAVVGATWPIYVGAFLIALAWYFARLGFSSSGAESAHLTPQRSYDVKFR
jgi:hypothetical protein